MFRKIFSWFKNLFKSKKEESKPSTPSNKDPRGKKLTLWSTFYYLSKMKSDKEGYELMDMKGNKLGVKLTQEKFCNLAMEGSGVIDGVVYGYEGKAKTKQVTCKYAPSGYVRFNKDPHKYGTGVKNWALTPFKSIAVDKRTIPYGSTVFIPAAVGVEYEFEGKKHVHDGYFFAQDTGGKIKGNHIDVYLGPVDNVLGNWKDALNANPFKFIKSKETGTFNAIIVDEHYEEENPHRDNEDEDKPDDGGDTRDQPRGEKNLWYPKALKSSYKMRTRGSYKKKYPQGAVVHYTSGRSRHRGDGGPRNAPDHKTQGEWSVKRAAEKGAYCYFIIDRDGNIHQNFPLDRWGYHAGKSSWKGISGSVSDELVGIEIQNAGRVKKAREGKYKAWFTTTSKGDKYFLEDEVRHAPKNKDNIQKGIYHKYSERQEEALIDLLLWLERNGGGIFKMDFVLGHDEVAPSRKADPGASLSMTMPEFRKLLKDKKKLMDG